MTIYADEVEVSPVSENIAGGDLQSVLASMGTLIEQAKSARDADMYNLLDQINSKLLSARDLVQSAEGETGYYKLNYLMEHFKALALSLNYPLPDFQEPMMPG